MNNPPIEDVMTSKMTDLQKTMTECMSCRLEDHSIHVEMKFLQFLLWTSSSSRKLRCCYIL